MLVRSITIGAVWSAVLIIPALALGSDFVGSPDLPTVLDGPVEYEGHQYYLLSQSNWSAAEAAAIELGGHLVAIGSAAENDFVIATFGSFFQFDNWRFWIGLTDQDQEGIFVWSNGEPVVYTNWATGEPNQQGDEDWVHIYGTDVPDWAALRWNDIEDVVDPDLGPGFGVVEVADGVASRPANWSRIKNLFR